MQRLLVGLITAAVATLQLSMIASADDETGATPMANPAKMDPRHWWTDPDVILGHDFGRTHNCSSFYPGRYLPSFHLFGKVWVGYDVGIDGAISNVVLIRSSGSDELDQAALKCVREHWQETPALKNGVPIATPGHRAAIIFLNAVDHDN